MGKLLKVLGNLMMFIAVGCLVYSVFYFMKFNEPIIKNSTLLYTTLVVNLILITAAIFYKKVSEKKEIKVINILMSLSFSAFVVYSLMNSVIVDYFQPLSLYDQIIYVSIVGLLLMILTAIVQSVIGLLTGKVELKYIMIVVLTTIFILQFYALGTLQTDFEYTNIEGEAIEIFEGGEGGYEIFRIPTLLVIPEGSLLATGERLETDRIIVMAEARRNGSLDDGDIDLVQKISTDGGLTWSELMIVRTYETATGKIGNSTPVFDSNSGEIVLLHLAGEHPEDYKTYKMFSKDGGMTWSTPTYVFKGIVGPGHGIMIENGPYAGRLVVPGYLDGGSLSIYSDDHGETWMRSNHLDDGNEAEIVEVNEAGQLMMVVRTNIGVATKHDPLNKIYVTSEDGGMTWSDFKVLEDIKEPICMSSIVESNGVLYYSHPDDYYSRGQMTIAASYDEGQTFTKRKIIYQGASGYSELGVLSDGHLMLVFENGSIEYDERIILVKVPNFDTN